MRFIAFLGAAPGGYWCIRLALSKEQMKGKSFHPKDHHPMLIGSKLAVAGKVAGVLVKALKCLAYATVAGMVLQVSAKAPPVWHASTATSFTLTHAYLCYGAPGQVHQAR
jgi:hypothetical protein